MRGTSCVPLPGHLELPDRQSGATGQPAELREGLHDAGHPGGGYQAGLHRCTVDAPGDAQEFLELGEPHRQSSHQSGQDGRTPMKRDDVLRLLAVAGLILAAITIVVTFSDG